MKQIFVGFTFLSIIIVAVMILFSVHSESARKSEIRTNLTKNVEDALRATKTKDSYTISDTHEFVSDFAQNLLSNIDSDGEIDIKVISIDTNNGMVDLEVTESFKYPNGRNKKISVRKTVIID